MVEGLSGPSLIWYLTNERSRYSPITLLYFYGLITVRCCYLKVLTRILFVALWVLNHYVYKSSGKELYTGNL